MTNPKNHYNEWNIREVPNLQVCFWYNCLDIIGLKSSLFGQSPYRKRLILYNLNFFLKDLEVKIEPLNQKLELGTYEVVLKARVKITNTSSRLSFKWYKYNENTKQDEVLRSKQHFFLSLFTTLFYFHLLIR